MSNLADIRPGQVFGRYEFLAPIAQGGMAAVWAARQRGSRGFSKIVAIKTMLPTISEDPRFERMFLDEARIASRIRHNHVVEILDLGEQDAMLYLVMEWVDGESLSTIRRAASSQGGIPASVAVRIIADVCSGLHAAHELQDDEGQNIGLVHRDVSPQNILVGYDGVAKVTDFGVAKVAGRTSETTGAGQARGKPPYMAPEQALGHTIDRRADIFSLGIVLYQLVAERHPFRGENDIATLHNIISEQPIVSPRAFVPDLPSGLERLILQALERDPAKRLQSAREMELGLESLLDGELRRVRAEDVGRLVSACIGRRGEERRNALREAIRRADAAALARGTDGFFADLSSSPHSASPIGSAERSAPHASAPVASEPGGGRMTFAPQSGTGHARPNVESHMNTRGPDAEVEEPTAMDVTRAWGQDSSLPPSPEISQVSASRLHLPGAKLIGVLLALLLIPTVVMVFRGMLLPRGQFKEKAAQPRETEVLVSTVQGKFPMLVPIDAEALPSANEDEAELLVPSASARPLRTPTSPTTESKSTHKRGGPQVAPTRGPATAPTYVLPPISSPGF